MELIQAIALLCQLSGHAVEQTRCQQSYLNCVLKQNTKPKVDALQQCILEK